MRIITTIGQLSGPALNLTPSLWAVVALGVICAVVGLAWLKPSKPYFGGSLWFLDGLALAAILALAWAVGAHAPAAPVLVGLAGGLILGAVLARFDHVLDARGIVASAGLVLVGLAIAYVFAPGGEAPLGLALGFVLAGLAGSYQGRAGVGALAGAWAFAASAAAGVGSFVEGAGSLNATGMWLCACLTFAALLGAIAARAGRLLSGALMALVFLAGVWLVALRILHLRDLGVLVSAGLVGGLVVAWSFKPGRPQSIQVLLSALVFLGMATMAFSLRRGYGIALVGVGATSAALLVGRGGLLALLSPLSALALYRWFRELHPDTSRAFDIGQHYSLVGLVGGMLLGVAWQQYASLRARPTSLGMLGSAAVGLASAAIAVAAVVLLGPKGTVGVLIGAGLSPIWIALAGRASASAWLNAALISLVVVMAYAGSAAFGDFEPFTRLGIAVVATLIATLLWVVAALVSRSKYGEPDEPPVSPPATEVVS